MASITLNPSGVSASSDTRSVKWGKFARVGLAATIASSLANVVVYYLGDWTIGYNADFVELGSAFGIAVFTAVLAVIAVLTYAALLRYTDNPVRNFTYVSAVALVVSLVPDITFIPSEPGATIGQTLILCLMHVVAAGVIVGKLTSYSNEQS
jgi:magnesium-transporting ATPase (P-type)